jgi:Na+-driven multidrug efflux pump
MESNETLLRLVALYTLADATQLVFGGAQRGAGDTTWVMIISSVLHWAMAITEFVLMLFLFLSSSVLPVISAVDTDPAAVEEASQRAMASGVPDRVEERK